LANEVEENAYRPLLGKEQPVGTVLPAFELERV
jgi:hypothetical protein